MNPFECDSNNNTNFEPSNTNIIIWKESRGRKKNTYVTGWILEKEELKNYLKEFKQKHGCNGSLKEDDETNSFKIHFQGDKVNDIIEMIISKGVNSENITIKGQ